MRKLENLRLSSNSTTTSADGDILKFKNTYQYHPYHARTEVVSDKDSYIFVYSKDAVWSKLNGIEIPLTEQEASAQQAANFFSSNTRSSRLLLSDKQFSIRAAAPIQLHTMECKGVVITHPKYKNDQLVIYYHNTTHLPIRTILRINKKSVVTDIHKYAKYNDVVCAVTTETSINGADITQDNITEVTFLTPEDSKGQLFTK